MHKPLTCPKCNRKLTLRILFIVKGGCWKCGVDMPIAFVHSENEIIAPYGFTKAEIDLSVKNGVILEEKKYYGVYELSNICPACKTLTASPYVFHFSHLSETDPGILTSHYCSRCKLQFEAEDVNSKPFVYLKPVKSITVNES